MATIKSTNRKRNYTTARQQALVDNIPTSKTLAEAAIKAGYPAKNARQSAFQALQGMRGRVPDLMDQLGLSEQVLIDKHLRRHLNAKRIHYFQKDGKVTDSRKTEALEIQSKALDIGTCVELERSILRTLRREMPSTLAISRFLHSLSMQFQNPASLTLIQHVLVPLLAVLLAGFLLPDDGVLAGREAV